MTSRSGEDEKGISFRQLVVAFLAVVALCAVFFSLGFFVGYKERTAATATETVTPPSEVPQPVNPPVEDTGAAALGGTPASSASNSGSGPPAMPAEQTPGPEATESDMPNPSRTPARPPGSSQNASAAVVPARSAPIKGVTVQVAALSNREDAESLINVLKARGYAPSLMSPEQAHANDNFFRVVVGPFGSAAEAGKARDKLAQDGFKPFIRK